MRRSCELEVRDKNIDSQREGNGAQDWRQFNDGQFLLPSVLQRRLPSTFRDSHICGSEPAIPRSIFLARTTADTSGIQTRLSRNALSVSLSCVPFLRILVEDGIGDDAIARHSQPALLTSAPIAIADPLLRQACGQRVLGVGQAPPPTAEPVPWPLQAASGLTRRRLADRMPPCNDADHSRFFSSSSCPSPAVRKRGPIRPRLG